MSRISIKNESERKKRIVAGNKLGHIFDLLRPEIKPGRSTYEINKLAENLIKDSGGKPNFALEPGYRWAVCASVNATLIHGIPSKNIILKEGDILSIDRGNLDNNGYNGDACREVIPSMAKASIFFKGYLLSPAKRSPRSYSTVALV